MAILYNKVPFTLPGIHMDDSGIPTGVFTNQAENRLEGNVLDAYSYDDFDTAAARTVGMAFPMALPPWPPWSAGAQGRAEPSAHQ